jgi:hypothetical protein
MALLPAVPDDAHRANPRWALQTMTSSYAGGLPDGEFRWTIDDEELAVVVTSGDDDPAATIGYGHGAGAPVLDVRCSATAFLSLIGRGRIGRGLDIVTGSPELVMAFVEAMPLPARGSARAPV